MTPLIDHCLLACFTCMQTSDPQINEATSQSILTMLGVVAVPMLGALGLVVKVATHQRKLAKKLAQDDQD